jgi:ABC-2 type transport system ATP-binding protein
MSEQVGWAEPAAKARAAFVGFERVGRTFGDKVAVDDVTLEISTGTILGLIGPSGCGKTTLLRMLVGLLAPTEGSVRLLGHDPLQAGAALRQRVGFMPQQSVLFPNLSLEDNLSFAAALYGVRWRGRRSRRRELLRFVDLQEHRSTLLAHASGGMQRRLALAATLVHDPELLVLDEPTAGIDPLLRARFWQRFRELRDEGRTLVVSTQYVGEAAECDGVAVLVDGRLLAVDTPDGLVARAYAPVGGLPAGEAPDYDEVFVQLVRRARRERAMLGEVA